MSRNMKIMLSLTGLIFGLVIGFKAFQTIMIKKYMSGNHAVPVTVSSMEAKKEAWNELLHATGTLKALNGVNVTTESAGLIKTIHFISGTEISKDEVLLELNTDSDIALLNSFLANADLATIVYKRDQKLFKDKAVSQATIDASLADLKSKKAQVDAQLALLDKKKIKAPFKGRLGISDVNEGQYLNTGDTIVSLQSLNPILIDFYVPQQNLAKLKINQPVSIYSDSYPANVFSGKISAIEPQIDIHTRNVKVEATIDNPREELLPGMFASLTVDLGNAQQNITLPYSAITFNPYGETVYILKEDSKTPDGKQIYKAHSSFVNTGEKRGDQVSILSGIEEGNEVVTSGQLKIKNGSLVIIDNSRTPANNPHPSAPDK
ncbi:MAG: efflux transporter, family, subunit [Francisellaceae bacterium]|nr:efflux transporter, family, subunit [Francisellaceae bacterium]